MSNNVFFHYRTLRMKEMIILILKNLALKNKIFEEKGVVKDCVIKNFLLSNKEMLILQLSKINVEKLLELAGDYQFKLNLFVKAKMSL